MVKIICSDVDGTLLNKEREVDAQTSHAFARLTDDICLVLASSRMPKAMWHIQQKLHAETQPLICYNGALVLSSGQSFRPEIILSSKLIAGAAAQQTINLALALQLQVSIYRDNTWLISALDFYAQREINNTKTDADGTFADKQPNELAAFISGGLHKMMIMGEPAKIDQLISQLGTNLPFVLWRSKDIYLEITPVTNKLQGLKHLLQLWPPFTGLNLTNVMSFGDGYNDFELIKEAGFGIAMANGVDAIKEVAYAIAPPNKEHGVAVYLNSFFGH